MGNFKQKLLLIDGHALLHRAFHALPDMTSREGFPTGAIFGFLSMLFKALSDLKPTHALVVFDVPGPTFRDKLSVDYKATRKAAPDDLTRQLPKLKEILQALDIPVYEKPGFEADDLLGIIAHKTPKDVLNLIVTGDLDLLQLIDNHTHVYRFKIGFSDIQIFDTDKMQEVYGLHPSQWVDYKAIRGDTSDNIPGVRGIGEKGALELIKKFGSLDGVYEAVEQSPGQLKPGILKKLIAGKTAAYLSYKLARIDQKNHLDFDLKSARLGDYDQSKVLARLHGLGIKALDARLPAGEKNANEPGGVKTDNRKQITGNRRQEKLKANDLIKSPQEALIAAYLLNPGRREYQAGDWNELARELRSKKLVKIFQEIELPLVPVLQRMEARGVKVDLDWLTELSKKLGKRITQLEKEIHKLAGAEFNVASPKQLQEVLFEKLQIPTENLKKNKKSGGVSTAADSLEKLRGLHPIIDLIFEFRELAKLKSTYADALPELVSTQDRRLHTHYSQTIAATGRLSSSNPNLQNIPVRSGVGNEVRRAFVAEPGNALLSLDYSQIELRIAASLSNDLEMIKIFKSGGDFHRATAAKLFGVKESEVTAAQRRDAKTINFSVLYGVSAFGLSERTEMSRAAAAEHIKDYFKIFHQLKTYIDATIKKAKAQGFVANPLGRLRYFPEINSPVFGVRSAAERAAFNMPIQSLAADIIKMSMIRVDEFLGHPEQNAETNPRDRFLAPLGMTDGPATAGKSGMTTSPGCHMLLSVHDELVFEVAKDRAEEYARKIKPLMESVYALEVPLLVEAKMGANWAEMEKIGI